MLTLKISFLLCLILLSNPFPHQGPGRASAQLGSSTKNIFILAGQSNMAGRGGVVGDIWDGVVPVQCRPSPSIVRLNAKLQWEEAEEPLARDIDTARACGVGPGMSFAHALLGRIGPIGLVPCAVGGTNITQWAPGGYLYTQLVRRAYASVKEGGTIQALIWYQGESDTITKEDAEAYQRRLLRFFLHLRDDLQYPMLPIIQVAIASGQGPYIETVRQAQTGIDLLNLKTVDAIGLPMEPDHLHLTTPSQVQLGEKLASAFLQFLPSEVVQSNIGHILHRKSFYKYLTNSLLIVTLMERV